MEPIVIDETASLNYLADQSRVDTDYRDSIYSYSYASSNSEISCGSFNSGCLTPQSSVTTSASRRHSLASTSKSTTSYNTYIAQPTQSTTPRTPLTYESYLSQNLSAQHGYSYSSPTSPGLADAFAMEPEDNRLSGKLHLVLGLGEGSDMDIGPPTKYDQADIISPQSSFSNDHALQTSGHVKNQYDDYALGLSPYQDFSTSFSLNSIPESQPMRPPQTVAPSQTTFKAESTPPSRLSELFVSPVKSTFESSPIQEQSGLIEQLQSFAGTNNISASPSTIKSDDSDELRSIQSSCSEDDKAPSILPEPCNPKRKPWRKSQGSRQAGRLKVEIAQEGMSTSIKTEPHPRHPCKYCVPRRSFRRPEHLNRHMLSTHGLGVRELCKVPGCGKTIDARPDNMVAHYQNTHMYGPRKKEGKKNRFVTIEEARKFGIDHLDLRVHPRPPRGKKAKKEVRIDAVCKTYPVA